jgi:hypothetical protein
MNAYTPPIASALSPEERAEIAREGEWEALRAEIEDEFNEWRGGDWRNREHEEIGPWLVRMAQRHMRDCERYLEAMDASERRLSDAHLSHIVKGHKAFEQSEGWTR